MRKAFGIVIVLGLLLMAGVNILPTKATSACSGCLLTSVTHTFFPAESGRGNAEIGFNFWIGSTAFGTGKAWVAMGLLNYCCGTDTFQLFVEKDLSGVYCNGSVPIGTGNTVVKDLDIFPCTLPSGNYTLDITISGSPAYPATVTLEQQQL